MEFEYDLNNLEKASEFVLKSSKSNILLFSGVIGAGKTTLVKQLCKNLGVIDTVNSPTYSLINEYITKESTVFHIDLFRIEKIEEINSLGLLDYLASKNKVIIEWPEIIIDQLNQNYSHITIDYIRDDKRKITIKNR
ncbi:MAG: tRNA (adenosine(37)-N6)-threonylcarbamoyltransferase complex ATPase subunit type 1 TsaE [Flavobacteriaceae bacterium]|jgi:tRNA threonylcarbamoyladenosine biosynthesis protein TsaE|nr:tRNA (adenosine(37)-N6)-threonylcarbamoyltransferase complex ATPase subunit type 1 TsaE [Flavobacteriaceae bacterium]MBT3753392.1 tRNA (adenosine(37)-N6)-threonylcarbamoyltransferase complex ATPase subunit type 1 TsaE [Flavobacteriaceae bacterium]MBT4246603.1 tRNA (adenosine(37)-N6)-threonylcarbamoyltransferase complex ATPase subunit type 1 TsaE [Flavobacteriaceae bacterium]MBT4415947.1 tRNA (adenosine(37)-N6)-threonylcarbamoyltransferase complex ATPase subunit type 1 TsaE [Flavobacteriaceae 